MKTVWTKGLEKDAAGDITQAYKNAGLVRGRLTLLLEEKIKTEMKARTDRKDYDSPNWPYRQADSSGYIRALNEIKSLIS